MDSNTNQKINQVSENTLVIGIDIAKHKHYACVIDERGRVLQKSFPFYNYVMDLINFMKEFKQFV